MINTKEFQSEIGGVGMNAIVDDGNAPERIEEDGWTGSRSPSAENTDRILKDDIQLPVRIPRITMAQMKAIVGWIYDTTENTLKDPSDPANQIAVIVNRVIHYVKYGGCAINTLKLSGGASSPLEAELGLLGTVTRDFSAQTMAAPLVTKALAMIDCSFTVGGTTYKPAGFELEINQNLEADFANSVTPDSFALGDLGITGSLDVIVSSASWAAIMATAYADRQTIAIQYTITLGDDSVTIDIPKAGITGTPPKPADKGTWRGSVAWEALDNGAASPITFTLV